MERPFPRLGTHDCPSCRRVQPHGRGRRQPFIPVKQHVEKRAVAHLGDLRNDGADGRKRLGHDGRIGIEHAHPIGKFDVHGEHRKFIEYALQDAGDLLAAHRLRIDGDHGRRIAFFQSRAQFPGVLGLAAVEQDDEGLFDFLHLGDAARLCFLVVLPRDPGDGAVRRHDDADRRVIAHHLAGPLLRRRFKGHGRLAPRRLDEAGLAVLLKSRRSAHGETDAIHKAHARIRLPEGNGDRLLGHKLGLRRHHRPARGRLRQFIDHALSFRPLRPREHEFLHEPLDKGRFTRPDRPHDTDVDLPARARRNVLIYADIFHTPLRCFLVYPMAEERRI